MKTLDLEKSDQLWSIVRHQIGSGGKRIRPIISILCCEAVGGKAETALPSAVAIELAHNYTLIFDDIIDHSDLRRGLPTIRAKYGDVMAILAGMYYREAVFDAARMSTQSEKIEEITSRTLKKIIEGESLDVLFEQAGQEGEYIQAMRRKSINEKDYFDMIGKKTAGLFEAACKVGGTVGNGTSNQIDALSKFGWNCGLAFQIMDDVLDITANKEEFGKDIGKDVKEHKLGNFVILYALKELSAYQGNELLEILRLPKVGKTDVDKAIRMIIATKAPEHAQEVSKEFLTKAKTQLNDLPSTDARDLLFGLADFICKRSY